MSGHVMRLIGGLVSDRKKERFEIILEPFQAITQLALLSFCPLGTKLSITDNILYLQVPAWTQGLERRFNVDRRDDLFFLFKVISRYNSFYKHLKTQGGTLAQLFDLLTELAKIGMDRLVQTYTAAGSDSLLHTLRLYRTMLEKPELVAEDERGEGEGVDDVFIHIRDIYDDSFLKAIYHILKVAQNDPPGYQGYMQAIGAMYTSLTPVIQKWIADRIVF